MKTNANAEPPQDELLFCDTCGENIEKCKKCNNYFGDEEDILCYQDEHYCEECAKNIKKKGKKS